MGTAFYLCNRQGCDSYVQGTAIAWGDESPNWNLPVGSNFCIFEETGNGYLDVFKVTGSGHYNRPEIAGTLFHTWIEGYYPDLVYEGYKSSVAGGQPAIDACAAGW